VILISIRVGGYGSPLQKVAAESPTKQFHTKGVKIPGTVHASPSPGAADEVSVKNKSDSGRGEGERFSNPIFRIGALKSFLVFKENGASLPRRLRNQAFSQWAVTRLCQ